MQPSELRILLVDDDQEQYVLVRKYLAQSHSGPYTIEWASTFEAALGSITGSPFDLCLLDYNLGEKTGIEFLEEVRARGIDIPVILLTGQGSFEMDVEAMEKGVADYMEKGDLSAVLLERSIRYTMGSHRARIELEEMNRELQSSLRQIEEDQAAARRIQLQLMPEAHLIIDEYEFGYFLKTSASLSGDFADYFRIDQTHLAMYIADVSGHGVPSALVTVLLKSTVNRLLEEYSRGERDTILHPEQVLSTINDAILQQELDKYLTMFYAVISEEDNLLTFSNGGHFPAPILCTDGAAQFLENKNLPVGLFEGAAYETKAMELPDAYTLTVFSDGVLEVLGKESLKAKEDELLSLVNDIEVTIETLVAELGLQSVKAPVDDITLLMARKRL